LHRSETENKNLKEAFTYWEESDGLYQGYLNDNQIIGRKVKHSKT